MASISNKNQKEKNHSVVPKMVPRPTAASMARAARNASNRNLALPSASAKPHCLSPSRPPSSQGAKGKTSTTAHSNFPRCDSKISFKSNQQSDVDYERITIDVNNTQSLNANYPLEGNPSTLMIIDDTDKSEPTQEIEQLQNVEEPTQQNDKSKQSIKVEEEIIEKGLAIMSQRPRSASNSSSRTPQTPLSRPQTPRTVPTRFTLAEGRANSRPVTPKSRPTTPHNRSMTPGATNVHSLSPHANPSTIPRQNSDLTTVFASRQRQFQEMKKELDLKQQSVLEAFEELRQLREKLKDEDSGKVDESTLQDELVVFNVADWTAEEIAQLCRDAAAASSVNGVAEMFNDTIQTGEKCLDEITSKIYDVPTQFAELCIQVFTARQEIIDWVKDFVSDKEKGSGEELEKISIYNAQGLEFCEALRKLKTRADATAQSTTQFLKKTFQERSALLGAGENLIREVSKLRTDLDDKSKFLASIEEGGEGAAVKVYEETRHELEEERQAKVSLKEKLAVAETQLRTARSRITKMDRQLREAEASIAGLTGTVKSLEDQSRQREVQLEARARKLRESLKTGEMTSCQLSQQRDSLQAELQDCKDTIAKMTAQHKTNVHDLMEQLKSMKRNFEEQSQRTNEEAELKRSTEEALNECHKQIDDLNAKIKEYEDKKPNPDLPTEREMELWAELQATKETLRMTEDEVTICKREKVRFLETLTKITESDNKIGLQQKLAAELMSKEEIIGKMQSQIRELTKNTKLHEQRVLQYQQYVQDIQAYSHAFTVNHCQEESNGTSFQDLHPEVMKLRLSLLESVHRNEELQDLLIEKDQQIEQQDKTSRTQETVIKVREGLISMLKNKETEQSRELKMLQLDLEQRMQIVEEVNKQITAKAEEIQALFSTLDTKQQQIHRLEKIVLALEEQQRRGQEQRIRNEEKIAALEHELAGGGCKRERKFLFF